MLFRLGARAASLFFVLLSVTFLVNGLLYLVPGDPVDSLVGQSVSEEMRRELREEMGLDKPFLKQYLHFLERLVHGDLGRSLITRRPVAESLLERFPRTMLLAFAAVLFAVAVGVLAGMVTALVPGTLVDRGVMVLAVLGVSLPVFVVALGLRYCFAERWPLFPPAGYGGAAFLILPALTLGSRSAAYLARVTRTTLLEILNENFIRTARAKGRSRWGALVVHALPNAAAPLISVILLDLAMYLNGSVITESIFAWPGLGRYALTAIFQRDLPAIQGVVLVTAATYILVMNLADLLRFWLDPRIRREGSR
ncbi:MAG: ABC transporter permease [Candidatus Hydrogenedentota bacterium]|nr:MAG: ABC transporter permease [Candidatus Hydrogenedentota bacterium]